MGKQSSGTVVQNTLKNGVTTIYGQFKSDGIIGPQDIGGTDKTLSAGGNNLGVKGVRCVATGVYTIQFDTWIGAYQFLGSSAASVYQNAALAPGAAPRFSRVLVEKTANAPLLQAEVTGIGSLATGVVNCNPTFKNLVIGEQVQRLVPESGIVDAVGPLAVAKGIVGVAGGSTLTVGAAVRKVVGGVLSGPTYYVVAVSPTTVTLSDQPGGAGIDLTGVFVVTDEIRSTTNRALTGAVYYVVAVNAAGNSVTLSATEGGAGAVLTGLFAVGNSIKAIAPSGGFAVEGGISPYIQLFVQNITGGAVSIPSGGIMQFTTNVASNTCY